MANDLTDTGNSPQGFRDGRREGRLDDLGVTAGFIRPFASSTSPTARPGRDQAVQRAAAYLRDHVGEGVRIGDLCRIAGLSERALRNGFVRQHGMAPKQFDLQQRLNEARRALREQTAPHNVTTIATQFGFFDLSRFARMYKDAFGETPSRTAQVSRSCRAERG